MDSFNVGDAVNDYGYVAHPLTAPKVREYLEAMPGEVVLIESEHAEPDELIMFKKDLEDPHEKLKRLMPWES